MSLPKVGNEVEVTVDGCIEKRLLVYWPFPHVVSLNHYHKRKCRCKLCAEEK